MSYRIERSERVVDAVGRVARDQIDEALAAVDDDDVHEAVHEIRKRCKKIRAALRLVRHSFDDYDAENADFRDTARLLSDGRDATAHLECFDALVERFGAALDEEEMASVRQQLVAHRDREAARVQLRARLSESRDRLVRGRERTDTWTLSAEGFEVVGPGLRTPYARARKRMKDARDGGDADTFHRWRKRVKYHRYHLALLRDLWPPIVEARREQCHQLTDLLGEDHDFVELRRVLSGDSLDIANATREALFDISERRSRDLRDRSLEQGKRLFTEKPNHFVRRVGAWWEAHRGDRTARS